MVGRSVNMEKGNLLGNHYIPTRIVFGTGKIKELSILRMPGKKALIVISKGKSVERNGYLKILTEQLSSVGIGWEVFAEIRENPNTCNVMDGAKAAKESGCDFIIGFGGGSCMDAAKAIAVMSVNKGDIWEYMTSGTGKSRRTTTKPLPVVTIPTNAGSGSSVDPWATITNDVTQEKLGYGYGETFPVLALIDPKIMCTVPKSYTIYQGFDIFFHAMECYISRFANAFSDMYAREALHYWKMGFRGAVLDGADLLAREALALADIYASMAMCNCPVTSLHGLEHALSAVHPKLPHGAGLLLLEDAWLERISKYSSVADRLAEVAALVADESMSVASDLRSVLKQYRKFCEIEKLCLQDFGIQPIDAERYVQKAEEMAGDIFYSDRVKLEKENCVEIFEQFGH